MGFIRKIRRLSSALEDIDRKIDVLCQGVGRMQSQLNAARSDTDPSAFEFRVSSQWGEDGIIDRLVHLLDPANKIFVEFGVENYRESNTRFLLQNRYWAGLIIDGSEANVASIRSSELYWRYNLKAESAFIHRDNINSLIAQAGIEGDVGLLSIDIDGNDYWVWDAISIISPQIVVAEYNGIFGPQATVTIPYDPAFRRSVAHPSGLYYGASVAALAVLGSARGYSLICGNSAGNNAFFVRNDLAARFPRRSPAEVYRRACFREARDDSGRLLFISQTEAARLIAHLPVVDVETGDRLTLGAALGSSS